MKRLACIAARPPPAARPGPAARRGRAPDVRRDVRRRGRVPAHRQGHARTASRTTTAAPARRPACCSTRRTARSATFVTVHADDFETIVRVTATRTAGPRPTSTTRRFPRWASATSRSARELRRVLPDRQGPRPDRPPRAEARGEGQAVRRAGPGRRASTRVVTVGRVGEPRVRHAVRAGRSTPTTSARATSPGYLDQIIQGSGFANFTLGNLIMMLRRARCSSGWRSRRTTSRCSWCRSASASSSATSRCRCRSSTACRST